MSAIGLQISAQHFDNQASIQDAQTGNSPVSSSISYSYNTTGHVTTLSTHATTFAADPNGFLYVPDLTASASCVNASAPFIPWNVTRHGDLPSNAQIVAIAPWLSPTCVQSYLSSAQSVGTPLTAFIFFLPNGPGPASADPPLANDPAWSLGDGGQWETTYAFPVFAVPTSVGLEILAQMALYSGDIASAPSGDELVKLYGGLSQVRLYGIINTGSLSSGIPSIWIFLLIILAVLMVAVGMVSCIMHIVQRKRRQDLRRRVAANEVDIEALGVSKMTVPPHIIDAMPVRPYQSANPGPPSLTKESSLPPHPDQSKYAPASVAENAAISEKPRLFQPTCAICLEDFVESETSVRELPCSHIYHPDCIDTFLRENSSLCPLCKKTCLPKGYCPVDITNIMVMRERQIRRERERSARREEMQAASPNAQSPRLVNPHGPVELEIDPDPTIEMTPMESQAASAPPPNTVQGRREWARLRALAMLGSNATTDSTVHAQTASGPRKLLRSLFPGFG